MRLLRGVLLHRRPSPQASGRSGVAPKIVKHPAPTGDPWDVIRKVKDCPYLVAVSLKACISVSRQRRCCLSGDPVKSAGPLDFFEPEPGVIVRSIGGWPRVDHAPYDNRGVAHGLSDSTLCVVALLPRCGTRMPAAIHKTVSWPRCSPAPLLRGCLRARDRRGDARAPRPPRGFLSGPTGKCVTVSVLESVGQVGLNKVGAKGSSTVYPVAKAGRWEHKCLETHQGLASAREARCTRPGAQIPRSVCAFP